jgi:hypothetical protein
MNVNMLHRTAFRKQLVLIRITKNTVGEHVEHSNNSPVCLGCNGIILVAICSRFLSMNVNMLHRTAFRKQLVLIRITKHTVGDHDLLPNLAI